MLAASAAQRPLDAEVERIVLLSEDGSAHDVLALTLQNTTDSDVPLAEDCIVFVFKYHDSTTELITARDWGGREVVEATEDALRTERLVRVPAKGNVPAHGTRTLAVHVRHMDLARRMDKSGTLMLDDPLYALDLPTLPVARIRYRATAVFPASPFQCEIVADGAQIRTSRTASWEWGLGVTTGDNLHMSAHQERGTVVSAPRSLDDAIAEVYRLLLRSYIWAWPETERLRDLLHHPSIAPKIEPVEELPDEEVLVDMAHVERAGRYRALLSHLVEVREAILAEVVAAEGMEVRAERLSAPARTSVRELDSPASPVMMSANREAALSSFLADIFDGDAAGLRRWVRLSLGKEIHDELPEGSANLSHLVFETTLAIQRHGRANAALFVSLHELRPQWGDRIWDVARLYGVARQMQENAARSRDGTAAQEPSTVTLGSTRAVADPVDPLAMRLEDALKRKQKLEAAGLSTSAVLAEIRALKREHRRGGQLRPGDALGDRYLLAEQIGRGGFATVWSARDTASGDDVAIKVLHPELAGDLIRRQRFFRGARIMAELAHPLVVNIREREVEDDGFFYFVMDFIPGGNLQDAVLEQRVKPEHVVPIILGIGEALAEAHRRGHVHRDVKPVNILLTDTGAPRLTDFDLVTGQDTTGGTRTGALGTFIYAAPEMMERPQDADARADVYGLGMTMAFMLHGDRLPRKALTARKRFMEDIRATPALEAFLKQATAEDLEDRYPDAAAFCDALRAASSLDEGVLPENITESVDVQRTNLQFVSKAMEKLPGGTFWMGSRDDDELAAEDEKPLHQVEISPFWCMRYLVTRELWVAVMGAPHDWWPHGPADNRPVNHVSWYDAVRFCNVLSEREGLTPCYRGEGNEVTWVTSEGYRLPTEAEWEYGCRAGTRIRWSFGDDDAAIDNFVWFKGNSGVEPRPVGLKQPNSWGLYDMHGNVWEWCWDWYARYPEPAGHEPWVNPRGPKQGATRLLRGGSFTDGPSDLRCAYRFKGWPQDQDRLFGFRCVRGFARQR